MDLDGRGSEEANGDEVGVVRVPRVGGTRLEGRGVQSSSPSVEGIEWDSLADAEGGGGQAGIVEACEALPPAGMKGRVRTAAPWGGR
jgi:hypothetical protein